VLAIQAHALVRRLCGIVASDGKTSMRERMFMVTYVLQADKLRIAFAGRLDTARCSTIQNELMTQIEATELPVVFDLQEVSFIASSFLRLCLMSVRKLGAERFSLTAPSPAIEKVFVMAGLDKVIRIE
jgi:anti-anti-sigma factor